jgi:nitroreductase
MELNFVINQLNWRLATKTFDPDKKISDNDLDALLEALRLTPSSYGLQPWKFVVINDLELRKKLQAASYGQKQVKDASHLIVLCAKTSLGQNDVENYIETAARVRGLKLEDLSGFKKILSEFIGSKSKEELQIWAIKQVYIALGNLLTTCAMIKIDSCPMEGFDARAYDQILGLDKLGVTAVLICPVGYRLENAPEIKNKKVRFSRDELIIEV